MVLALAMALSLTGAPQAVSVKVTALELKGGSTTLDADLVSKAVSTELTKQGYAIVSEKAQARIAGRLEKSKDGYLVHLTLVREADAVELDDVKLRAGTREELTKAGTEGAKKLATEIRLAWGVRAKIKL